MSQGQEAEEKAGGGEEGNEKLWVPTERGSLEGWELCLDAKFNDLYYGLRAVRHDVKFQTEEG